MLILLNKRAGTMIDRGPDGMRDALHAALPGQKLDIRILDPRALIRAIGSIASSEHETIVIGGGDGSVSAASSVLAGTDKTLGILPFGTLNLLARDLNIPADPDEAIKSLAKATPRAIDLATLNGRVFHSISGLGFFSQMARAREEHRDLPGKILRVGAAALRALTRTGRFSLEIEVKGERRAIDTYALLVTCNHFDGEGWARQSLDGGALEVHIARDEGALGKLQAGANMLTGGWRDYEGIESFSATHLRIASSRHRAWVATDGELRREHMPLQYAIKPRALRVLGV